MEDAWNAVDRAKTIYNHIREKSLRIVPDAPNDEGDPLSFDVQIQGPGLGRVTATVNPMPRQARVYPKSSKSWLKPRSTP